MILINSVQEIVDTGAQQLITWVTQLLPKIFLFLILLNALTSLIGRSRVERLAAKCGSNTLLRYMVLPFLSAVVLGNPMAISMGRYLPERYKPAYFASASYHCHTNSGIFQHINPAELFLWLGIANGVLARGQDLFPLALRYLLAGLVANFVSGYATELITRRVEKKQGIRRRRRRKLLCLWRRLCMRSLLRRKLLNLCWPLRRRSVLIRAAAGQVTTPLRSSAAMAATAVL